MNAQAAMDEINARWLAAMVISAVAASPIALEAAGLAALWSALGACGVAAGVCLYADGVGRSP